ncbi:flocculation protein FLO11-like [Xiphophorus couchianus]|uniref:flocculation protein FLO11-like n=1 Tax=Xiphophorus couchianus TaxID=32473 RepID=UPI0010165D8B|nr:flocculation protein FLO11-like [Xiphophorus couchianus]
MLSSVLLLLLISGAQASYYGVVFSYSVGDLQPDGYPESNNFKVSFSSCEEFNSWYCDGDCSEYPVYPVDERGSDWCQTAYTETLSASFLSALDYPFDATNWTENRNGIELSAATLLIEIRNRSDINKPNSSPQTTIIPLLRVPSNCQRNINLLVSDPDGDDIRCRYALFPECNICTPPSVLSVSSSCSLSFSPTNSSAEGPYAVQMVVEDFTGQNITLTNGNNSQEVKPQNDAISKIPVQFVFRVDPAAPSCTEGEYLPRFLPPTPEHGAQILTNVNQTLEIIVRAEATQAETTELLFSGPIGLAKSSSGSGNFSLTWTPSARDAGLKQTLCFVVQANSSGSVYQSDFRCVFVTTGSTAATVSPPTTTATASTTFMTIQPPFTTTPPPTTPPPTTTAPPPTTPPPTTPPPTTTAPPPTTPPPTTPPPTTTAPPPTTTAPPPITTTPPPTTTDQPTTITALPSTTTIVFPPTTNLPTATFAPGPYYVLALNAKLYTSLSLENDSATIIKLIKDELKRRGLPPDIMLKLLSDGVVKATA